MAAATGAGFGKEALCRAAQCLRTRKKGRCCRLMLLKLLWCFRDTELRSDYNKADVNRREKLGGGQRAEESWGV